MKRKNNTKSKEMSKSKFAKTHIPLRLLQGETKRPLGFTETRMTNHDGEKVMAFAMSYVHYSKVLVRISNMAGTEFGSEIRKEVETGEPSNISESAIVPREWCEADARVGPYPTEENFKRSTRGDAPRLNVALSTAEKEVFERQIKLFEKHEEIKQKEWTGLRKTYLENKGKCITKILTECTSESIRNAMRNDKTYHDAIDADSVAEFMNWYTDAVKRTVGFNDKDKEKLEIQKLLGSDEDHLKILQLNGPQDYITCIKNLLKDYKKLLLSSKIVYKEAELNAMTPERFKEEVRRMEESIEYDIDHNGLFKRTIFRELRDSGFKNDNAITRSVKVLQATKGQDNDTPPYDTISEMLEAMTVLINTVLLENIQGIKLYHQTRNEERAKAAEDKIRINNQRTNIGDKGKKGCNYCLKTLKREETSKNHDWYHCFYNKNCSKYLGDERKKLAEEKVNETPGKKKISVNAMIKKLYNQAIEQKPEGRQD
jgi:hypothetical protein